MGVLPTVDLHGPWEDQKRKKDTEGEEAPEEAPEDTPEDTPVIDFDRLLLKNRESREFSINNTCAIPVGWRLQLSEQLQSRPEFDVGPLEGVVSHTAHGTRHTGFSPPH